MGLRGRQGACQSLGKRKGELHASIHEHGEPVGKVALTECGRGECGRRNTNSLWSSGDLSLVRGGVWPGPHLASRMASPHGPPVPPSQAEAGNFQGLNMGPSRPALACSVPLILGSRLGQTGTVSAQDRTWKHGHAVAIRWITLPHTPMGVLQAGPLASSAGSCRCAGDSDPWASCTGTLTA